LGFTKLFTSSLESTDKQDNVILKGAHSSTSLLFLPLMLRRVKNNMTHDLPPKKETKFFIGLTDMQQQWYTKVLKKDAHELNASREPDRARLLNILMQLRKVCNHPYLFERADSGPLCKDELHL